MLNLLWLIPLLPFLGFVLNGLLGARVLSRRAVGIVACAAVGLSFLLSLGAVIDLGGVAASSGAVGAPEGHATTRFAQDLFTWIPMGQGPNGADLMVRWGYLL